jgi:ANTAR domain
VVFAEGSAESPDAGEVSATLSAAADQAGDPRAVPEALCRASLRLLPVTGAAVVLAAGRDAHATWYASDPVAARLAELQYTLADGPSQAALDWYAPVLAADLTSDADTRRWPVFAQQAVALGVRAAFSLPLGTSASPIGTLGLYRDVPGPLSERDLATALLVGDTMTIAVLKAAGDGTAAWLDTAYADHAEVHQAVGMVMTQLDVDPRQALDRMRARAFAESRTVTEVARDVLARTLRFTGGGTGGGAEDRGPDRDGRA